MSFVRPKSSALALLAAACLMGAVYSTSADAARQPPAPKLSGLKARVGQGGRVDLVASSLTAAQLASLRPDYEKLKPRARTNAE